MSDWATLASREELIARICELEQSLLEVLDLYDAAECAGPTRSERERVAEIRAITSAWRAQVAQ